MLQPQQERITSTYRESARDRAWREARSKQHLKFDVTDDIDEATEILESLLKAGERPVITVPEEYIGHVRDKGIPQTPQWDRSGRGKHYSVLAARIGADPFFNADEERWVVEVDPSGLKIHPRMTGSDKAFYGTVVVDGRITASQIRVVGKFSRESWADRLDERKAEAA